MKRKPKYRLNPELQKLVDQIIQLPSEYIGFGGYSEVYRFIVSQPAIIDNNVLNPGDYVIKIFFNNYRILDNKTIKYFKKLSNEKLIPEIYIISDEYVIMDYIKGVVLVKILDIIHKDWEIAINKIKTEAKRWWKKGQYHNDLNPGNIIFRPDGLVTFIDPAKYPIGKEKDIEQIDKLEYRFRYGVWA